MQIELRQAHTRHLDELEPLVAAYHAFEGIPSDRETRSAALSQLLEDGRLGTVWRVCVDAQLAGYIALCRGFSIEFNGFDAFVDEFYLLPDFRGRGVGKRVLGMIADEARNLDINALHLEVARANEPARRLYRGAGFEARDKYVLMTLELANDNPGR